MVDDKNQYVDEYEEEKEELELCTFDDDLPQLTEAEIHDKPVSHEWYYFDLQTKDEKEEDEKELVVRYIIKDSTVHDTNPSISLEFTSKTKKIERIKVYERDDYKKEKIVNEQNEQGVIIRIDTNLIKIYKDHEDEDNIAKYILILKFDEFEMNLECTPMHQGFRLSNNRSYFKGKTNDEYVSAVLPAPRMKVKGELIIAKERLELEGEGYHDHSWGTTSFIYSHEEWHWGRVYTDKFTAVFAEVIPSHDFSGKMKFLYYAKVGSWKPELESKLTITPIKWVLKFRYALLFIFWYPRELSITTSSKRNVSVKTSWIKILKFLQIYIRFKADAVFIDNNEEFKGVGWVEYYKVPAIAPKEKLMSSTKEKYKNWILDANYK